VSFIENVIAKNKVKSLGFEVVISLNLGAQNSSLPDVIIDIPKDTFSAASAAILSAI
jgi:hypothetical protein